MSLLVRFAIPKNLGTRTLIRVGSAWLLAACCSLFAPSPLLLSAWSSFPFEDMNNNGVYDAGDRDVTAEIMDDGFFSTSESLVIPAEVGQLKSSKGGFVLLAGKNLTVNAGLTTKKIDSIFLQAGGGAVTVGDGAILQAGDMVNIHAGGDVIVGAHAAVKAKKGIGLVVLTSQEGSVRLMEGAELSATSSVRIVQSGAAGTVTMLPGSSLNSPDGGTVVSAVGDIAVNNSHLAIGYLRLLTEGHLIDFRDNMVVLPLGGGMVFLRAAGSTIDISGTQFKNLSAGNLIMDAEIVVQ
jgi:hypothetical protein